MALADVLVRYWSGHAEALPSAEQARIESALILEHFTTAAVADLEPARVDAFVDWLRATGRSGGYIGRVLSTLRAALNWCHRRGELASVPFVRTVEPGEAYDRVLTPAQLARLWDAAEPVHLQRYFMILSCCAARPEAVPELRGRQIDLAHRRLDFNAPGRRQTKKRRPVVPICDTLLPWLEGFGVDVPVVHVVVGGRAKAVDSVRTAWRLMVARAVATVRGEGATKAHRLWRLSDRLGAWAAVAAAKAEAAGIGGIAPKTVRHTAGTELRARGVPEWEAAGFMGHRTMYRTTEVYAKYRPDYLAAAARAIDAWWLEIASRAVRPIVPAEPVRVSCVLGGMKRMVGATGIEPVTPTMSTVQFPRKSTG